MQGNGLVLAEVTDIRPKGTMPQEPGIKPGDLRKNNAAARNRKGVVGSRGRNMPSKPKPTATSPTTFMQTFFIPACTDL